MRGLFICLKGEITRVSTAQLLVYIATILAQFKCFDMFKMGVKLILSINEERTRVTEADQFSSDKMGADFPRGVHYQGTDGTLLIFYHRCRL